MANMSWFESRYRSQCKYLSEEDCTCLLKVRDIEAIDDDEYSDVFYSENVCSEDNIVTKNEEENQLEAVGTPGHIRELVNWSHKLSFRQFQAVLQSFCEVFRDCL